MSATSLGIASLVCLAAGAADLTVLNVVVVPSLEPTAVPASRPTVAPPERALPAPAPVNQLLLASSLAAPQPSASAPVPLPEITLHFDTSAHWVDARSRALLQRTLSRLQTAPEILVVGHADPSGPEDLNERLSGLRAAAVARRLAELGVPRKRLRVEARGEREPRPDGNSRRVEIYIGGQQ